VALGVGELAQWDAQHSLMGVGHGFLMSLTATVRLAPIYGISEGTRVSGSDDKTSERPRNDRVRMASAEADRSTDDTIQGRGIEGS